MKWRSAAVLAMLLALMSSASARALTAPGGVPVESPSRPRTSIALVEGGARELRARLRAELESSGWRVVEINPGTDVALAKIARRAGTFAVVRIGRDGDGIEIWVAPEMLAEASSEWIDVEASSPDLAVVRAVEALRARFLELGLEPETASPPAAQTPVAEQRQTIDAAPREAKPPSRTPLPKPALKRARGLAGQAETAGAALRLRLQGGAAYSPGGLGVSPQGVLGLRWEPGASWALGAELWAAPVASEFREREGTAEARSYFAGLSLDYSLPAGAFVGSAGVGVGAALFDVNGEPAPGYLRQREQVVTMVPFFRAVAAYRLARRLSARLDGTAGVSLPQVSVRFDGEDVAIWGRPLLAATAGLEWSVWD